MMMISLYETDKKQQHSHAHRLLRECLKKVGIAYTEGEGLSEGEHGKPFLTEHPDIHFNLSHSHGIAACILRSSPCGIDCERVRGYRENVVRRSFSPDEQLQIETADPSERDLLLFRFWTLKEAYVKAIGIGISYPLNEAAFRINGNKIDTDLKGCTFHQHLIRGGEYVVSACIMDEDTSGGKI